MTKIMVKVIQINLHHSKAASVALLLRMAKEGEELALIEEPWIRCDKVYILYDFSDEDTVAVGIETKSGKIYI